MIYSTPFGVCYLFGVKKTMNKTTIQWLARLLVAKRANLAL